MRRGLWATAAAAGALALACGNLITLAQETDAGADAGADGGAGDATTPSAIDPKDVCNSAYEDWTTDAGQSGWSFSDPPPSIGQGGLDVVATFGGADGGLGRSFVTHSLKVCPKLRISFQFSSVTTSQTSMTLFQLFNAGASVLTFAIASGGVVFSAPHTVTSAPQLATSNHIVVIDINVTTPKTATLMLDGIVLSAPGPFSYDSFEIGRTEPFFDANGVGIFPVTVE